MHEIITSTRPCIWQHALATRPVSIVPARDPDVAKSFGLFGCDSHELSRIRTPTAAESSNLPFRFSAPGLKHGGERQEDLRSGGPDSPRTRRHANEISRSFFFFLLFFPFLLALPFSRKHGEGFFRWVHLSCSHESHYKVSLQGIIIMKVIARSHCKESLQGVMARIATCT